MSLLVDPDYAIHALRLAYLRRIDDHAGPRVITFPSVLNLPPKEGSSSKTHQIGHHSSDGFVDLGGASPSPRLNNGFANSTVLSPLPSHSPVIIAGLNDARYQPELATLHSPNLNSLFALHQNAKSDIFGGSTSRLGSDGQFRRASEGKSGGGLKYTTTIVGSGRTGGLGMRVGGRRAVSRDGHFKGRASSKGDSLLEEEGSENETRSDVHTPVEFSEENMVDSSKSAIAHRNQRSSSFLAINEKDNVTGNWPHPRNRSSSQPFQAVGNSKSTAPTTPEVKFTTSIDKNAELLPREQVIAATPPSRPPRASSRSFTSQNAPDDLLANDPRLPYKDIPHRIPSSLSASLHSRRRSASEGATDFLRSMTNKNVDLAESSSHERRESDLDSSDQPHEGPNTSVPSTLGRMDSDSTIFSLASPVAARKRGLSDRSQGESTGTTNTASPFLMSRPSFSSYQLGKPSNLSPATSRTRMLDSSPLSKKTTIVSPDGETDGNMKLGDVEVINGSLSRRGYSSAIGDSSRDVTFESVEGSSTYLAAPSISALGLQIRQGNQEDKPPSPRPRLKLDVYTDNADSTPSSLGGPKRRVRAKPSASQIKADLEAQQRQEFFKSLKSDPQIVAARFKSKPQKSGISELMSKHNDGPDNPFAAYYKGVGDGNVAFELYFPFAGSNDSSDRPKSGAKTLNTKSKSMTLNVRKDATMEEVIGYGLYCYFEEGWLPRLEDKVVQGATEEEREIIMSTLGWTLRIVEDGEVDDDYPAIDRSLLVGKFGADELAICEATSAQIRQHVALQSTIKRKVTPQGKAVGSTSTVANTSNESTAQQQSLAPLPGPSARLAATAGNITAGSLVNFGGTPIFASSVLSKSAMIPNTASIFLRILITPNSEVKYKTTLQVPSDVYLADVLETICRKRQLADIDQWALIVAEKVIVVPLDRTVESLQGNHDLVLVRRQDLGDQAENAALTGQSTNPSASIFKRLSQPIMPTKGYRGAKEMASTYKTYTVNRKQASFLGRHERSLTLDGDWVHIIPTDAKAFHSQSGTSSFPVSAIISCVQSRLPSNFKLIVARENDQKRYEFEAESSKVAAEIVEEINTLMKRNR